MTMKHWPAQDSEHFAKHVVIYKKELGNQHPWEMTVSCDTESCARHPKTCVVQRKPGPKDCINHVFVHAPKCKRGPVSRRTIVFPVTLSKMVEPMEP